MPTVATVDAGWSQPVLGQRVGTGRSARPETGSRPQQGARRPRPKRTVPVDVAVDSSWQILPAAQELRVRRRSAKHGSLHGAMVFFITSCPATYCCVSIPEQFLQLSSLVSFPFSTFSASLTQLSAHK